jgi:hypothetical protein
MPTTPGWHAACRKYDRLDTSRNGAAMDRHRTALAIAAISCLAACERTGAPPPKTETLAGLTANATTDAPERHVRVTDSGLAVDAPAAGDGLRPVPGPTGLRP